MKKLAGKIELLGILSFQCKTNPVNIFSTGKTTLYKNALFCWFLLITKLKEVNMFVFAMSYRIFTTIHSGFARLWF